jgi:isopentenyl-diphosphate delta-isomerase
MKGEERVSFFRGSQMNKEWKVQKEREAKQILILVDSKDREIGFATREECHSGSGKRHRAIMVFLTRDGSEKNNSKVGSVKETEVLLQMRGENKLGGGRWDCSATTHVLKGENYEEAAQRCLKNELGMGNPPKVNIVGSFNYTERLEGGKSSENEHLAVALGNYTGEVNLNEKEATKVVYVKVKEVLKDIRRNSKMYTKWCRLGLIIAFGNHRRKRRQGLRRIR